MGRQRRRWVGLVLLGTVLGWGAEGVAGFSVFNIQPETWGTSEKFPFNSPQLYPDLQHNRMFMDTVNTVVVMAMAGPVMAPNAFQMGKLENPEIDVPVGSRITWNIANISQVAIHNFAITSAAPPYPEIPELPAPQVKTAVLQPYNGKIYHGAYIILQAKKAGVAYYLSTIPGQAKAGMYGKIRVLP